MCQALLPVAAPVLAGLLQERLGETPKLLRFIRRTLGLQVAAEAQGEWRRERLARLEDPPDLKAVLPLPHAVVHAHPVLGRAISTAVGSLNSAVDWDDAKCASSDWLTWRSVSGSGNAARNTGLPGESPEARSAGVTATVAGSGRREFTLTVCNDGGCGDPAVQTVEVKTISSRQTSTDYDDDRLIDITSYTQFIVVRHHLEGDSAVATAPPPTTQYTAAFPSPATGMGCRLEDNDDSNTSDVPVCTGYELRADVDLSSFTNRTAIGSFAPTCEGNGDTISGLTMTQSRTSQVGLFTGILSSAVVRNLGVTGASITVTVTGHEPE